MVQFRMLGPLEVGTSAGPVAITGRHHPRLLAMLLDDANQVVSSDRLAAGLWDDRPPSTAARQVQNIAAALRRQLGPAGDRLRRIGSGYQIDVETAACYYRGRMREGLEHAYRALHAFRAIGERRAELTNLHWLGLAHSLLGELDTGIDYLGQALKIATESGNDPVGLILLTHMAEIQIYRGRLDLAGDHLQDAAELERESVSIDRTSDLPGVTARLLLAAGRPGEAIELAKRVVDEREDDADHRIRAAAMVTLAAAHDDAGDHGEAVAIYDRVLAMTEHDATVFHRVEAMVNRAGALLRHGDARADASALQALRTTRQADYRFLEGRALNVLAEIDLEAGRLPGTADRIRQALLIHRETGHRRGEAVSLQLLAECAAAEGDPATAGRLRQEARALWTDMGAAVPPNLRDGA